MKLYTNTIPFSYQWIDNKPCFLPVGTTFALVGADSCGLMLELVSELNKGADINYQSVNPSIFEAAFKAVEQLKS
tara:strand:+ start:1597 stop:1821 length:225 start_codon:yes stop_codon:yes gene_type:complete